MRPRQQRFVREYLIDRNGAAAAVRAGYSPHTARQIAYELLTRPDVAEAVRQGEAEVAANAQLAREAVLRGLLAAIDLARCQGNPAAMIAGWREIAKMCGYYAQERKQITLSGDGHRLRTKLEAMSDAELSAIARVGGNA
jgi:phage terminase small subunit